MLLRKLLLLTVCCLSLGMVTRSQRSYRAASVLSSGNWFRIKVKEAGIYRMDLAFLNSLGVNTSGLSSSAIRLYGNGGQLLSESNSGPWIDDLQENAIVVVDGGDGVFNGSDYILFYAPGPDQWTRDSLNARFDHHKNIYSNTATYFLTIGGTGRRVTTSAAVTGPNLVVTSFSERYFHELDSVSFLQSGRHWYGEEMADLPGRSLSRTFNIPLTGLVNGSTLTIRSQCISRSAGAASGIDVRVNNNLVSQLTLPPVGTGQFDLFAQQGGSIATTSISQNTVSVNFTYRPGSVNAQGWIDWFEIFARRSLALNGNEQLHFRDWTSVGNNIAEFVVANASAGTEIWEVTDPLNPGRMAGTLAGTEYRFVNNCSRLREYVAFNPANLPEPIASGAVAGQNLHTGGPVDMLIIAYPPFISEAQRLAQFHQQHDGLRSRVVTTDQVFNEFASGNPDPVALRDFAKMYYDRYHTSGNDSLKYLLLFGDASYDYKDRLVNNTNYVPAWENGISLDPLGTYTSDDFFGFLEDAEDINSGVSINDLDVGIGRVPARSIEEAKNFVDKVVAYYSPEAMGPWRNNFTFIADDEDQNLHLQDAEIVSATATQAAPVFNPAKIYLDAYPQQSGSAGSSYPQVNQAINNQVFNGTLIWNFAGHGGPRRLAEETILDQESVNNWNNATRLPLFITATCDFAPYDNPAVASLGENILLRPKTGAIALMTTTRVVFAFSNRIMNDNYMRIALQRGADGRYKRLGDAVREAKNYTYQTSGDITNNRKFTLIGDPALRIAFPELYARATRINNLPVTQTDTLSAKEKVVIEGEVTDVAGNLLSSYNGNVYPVIFDKPQAVQTLGNDAGSSPTMFTTQTNALFKGKATVVNGKFSFTFKVPKDINYQFGNGKLSLYAENGSQDGNGYFTNFLVGGTGTGTDNDAEGPRIKPFLNDEQFINGGITNENPVLLLKLSDSSGINTVGNGIGHDIIATLDDDNRQYFILNDFYQSDQDSYQQGSVRFQLPEMSPGPHHIKIKAWDVLNNSGEEILDFVVAKDEELELSHVLNYPNPFTTKTHFWFEHNKPGQDLQVRLQIFTVSGRIIKMIQKTINTTGNRSSELEWDGKDEYGDKVGKGVYLYKLSVTAPGRLKREKIEKLVIF